MMMTLAPKILQDRDVRLNWALDAAEQLRDFTLPLFANPTGVQNKGMTAPDGRTIYDPVTLADIEGETRLRNGLRTTFPGDSITGEEHPDHVGDNGWLWTLDPIDGTRAFMAGVPVWSTLIGLSYDGVPVMGVIDLPALDKRYVGTPERTWLVHAGAKRDVKTRACTDLRDSILSCTEPLAMFTPGQRGAYEMIRRTAKFSRLGLDALSYGLIAEGRIDIALEASLKPCDVAALIPVIQGAGGVLTNWHGGSAVHGGAVVAVGDPTLLPDIYPYLKRALDTQL